METYRAYFDAWAILHDYVLWVQAGGVDYYRCVDKAREWAAILLKAQTDCLRKAA